MARLFGRRPGAYALASLGIVLVPTAAALAAPSRQDAGAAALAGALSVESARGRLSVTLQDAPLDAVLDAIHEQTGVVVKVNGPVARAISDRFRGLSLEMALRRLLRPLNLAFVYAPARNAGVPGRLAEVVIYPGGARSGASATPAPGRPLAALSLAPSASAPSDVAGEAPEVPPAAEARLAALTRLGGKPATPGGAERVSARRELDAFINDPNPAVRRGALEVAETTRLASPDTLHHAALADADLQVRWAALAALVATSGRDAAVEVAESGLSSPSAGVRLASLEALGEQLGGEAGERAARRALADPDPAVRAKAVEIVAIIEEGKAIAPDADPPDDEADDHDDAADDSRPGQSG